ncbi:amidase [Shinella zoogloeoides]|uniref:Amidase n=1 Tax=Shinella zoogloeoides TaxID=352475 RepID=A0A6N8TI77_SHIZO|nr:amidase [Shinella zoogloeoides]MXO02135.1 amidase [Shinella zoogloeoides]
MNVVEASIGELREALQAGQATSVGLVAAYLNRIARYDRHGIALNAVPVLNPDMFAEARASDLRRARGETLGPLDGIPYTAKDSYKVKGLSVASGSPAFADLIATEDAFAISRLRAAGAVLIGLTNMPPMANGGMQRGVYGRAESPYNADYLTAAFGSGSSNGSGTATAASFAAFGLGEETWSSGRAPAANNGLCAYTPSRGVISVRGNWPLVPTMDVVVPHSRSMADMLELLDVIVADDPESRGDLWRRQSWIPIPKASAIRPPSYAAIAGTASLAGKRFGLPAMYINADPEAGTGGKVGIGGATGQRIDTRPSMLALCMAARAALEAAGAEVVVTDFPVVSNYEGDRPGAPTVATRSLVSAAYLRREIVDLSAWAWDDFLAANGDPALLRLADVDGGRIFPAPAGSLPDRYHGFDDHIADYPAHMRNHPVATFEDMPELAEGLRGLEETRRIDLEAWMDERGLDAVIFPAVADIGPADADVNPTSADLTWRNGTWVANGNLAIRHLGIPTVTVPMGMLADVAMPAGLTFAGRAWDDTALLAYACAFERTGRYRETPPRTPELAALPATASAPSATADLQLTVTAAPAGPGRQRLTIRAQGEAPLLWLTVDGEPVAFEQAGALATASLDLPENTHAHSEWRAPYGHIVIACAPGVAAYAIAGGTA